MSLVEIIKNLALKTYAIIEGESDYWFSFFYFSGDINA
jgi:hypothetical protein